MRRFALIFLCCIMTSCGVLKPKYITQVQHDTTTIYKNNTVFQHDSIYVYKDRITFTKGDTVYVNSIEYKDRWKTKTVHDTTVKEVSVFVDKEVPVEVEKPLSDIQKFFITFGKIFVAILLILIGYGGFKLFRKFNF